MFLLPGYNSSVEKERLGNIMAYGSEVGEEEEKKAQRHQKEEEEEVDRFEEIRSTYCA